MFKKLMKIRLLSLTSSSVGLSANAKKDTGTKKMLLYAILMLYVIGTVGFVFNMSFAEMARPFYEGGIGWFYFFFCFLAAFTLMFIFSIFSAKSQIFEAKDNELLLTMPIKPRDILLSRIAVIVLINVVFELAVVLPAGIQWWMAVPADPKAVAAFVLLCIALPLFSSAFSCLFGWLVSLITSRIRNKTPLTVIAFTVFLIAYMFGYNKLMSSITSLAQTGTQFAGKISGFQPAVFLGETVADGNLLYLLIFLAVFILPFIAVVLIISKNFNKTVFRNQASAKAERTDGVLRVSDIKKALFRREIKRLLSSATYLMNAGVGVIMILIAAVAVVVATGKITEILAEFEGGEALTAYIIPAMICLLASMVFFTAPSVSLEGKTLWILRSLPIGTKDILDAKLRMHIVLTSPAVLLLSVACLIALPSSLNYAAFIIIIPQLFTVFTAVMGLMCDLMHTNLNWLSEVQAVKQSISVILAMVFGLIAVAAPFVPAALLNGVCPPWIMLTAICAIYAAADILMYRWIKTKGVSRFEKL